jgi:peptidoglycan hydrolase-like protein with peptidoglycan-binding domain
MGDEGEDVAILQALLSLNTETEVETHGLFDSRTRMIVMQYQRVSEVVDKPGEVGASTWRCLLNV